ncbi:MAG: GspE/PulE family protein [Planctomycetota bacterium]|jgi:type IV pilus assembly protein PilB
MAIPAARKKLGDILIEDGVLNEEQLMTAIAKQKEEGGALGRVLQDLGLATESQILIALGSQLGMEVIEDLEHADIPPDVIAMVSKMMAEVYSILPYAFEEGELLVAMADPLNVHALDDLRFMLNVQVRGAVADHNSVRAAIERFYAQEENESIEGLIHEMDEDELIELSDEDGVSDSGQLEDLANQVPVVKLLNLVLLTAINDHAADIHFEPFEETFKIRYRIDGVLLEMQSPPRSLALPLISRIKVMSALNISERRIPQDGRIALNIAGRSIDLRVSTLPTMFGESVVLRLLDKSVVALDLHRLGMREDELATFEELIAKPNGIMLVTGPTGSGKTTTLYSCLNQVNDISVKIITTEDPVEYDLPGIIQCPIRSDIGVTYASCLRAILRQDPDKILVGEIRDKETADIAIEASLTGHLVFSTLHTQDAPSTIARLSDMGIESFLLAATMEAIVAQRLVRTICPNCKKAYNPPEEELMEVGLRADQVEGREFYYGTGCEECKKTGYKGRTALYEIMKTSAKLRELIIQNKSTEVMRDAARQMGMQSLRDAGLLKIFDGLTTIEEVVRETLSQE